MELKKIAIDKQYEKKLFPLKSLINSRSIGLLDILLFQS